MKPIYVFVYGTLKKGHERQHTMRDSKFLSDGIIYGCTMLDLGSYPALIDGDQTIIGELYQVPFKTLRILDTIEGHPIFYKRKFVDVKVGQRHIRTVRAWCYFLAKPLPGNFPIIESGEWQKN